MLSICDNADFTGTNGANVIIGTPGPDVIDARGGADTVRGRGGNDVICAGDGNDDDILRGGLDDDLLLGEAGTEKTASAHVSSILSKLSVRSRVEAAAAAHRLGLVEP